MHCDFNNELQISFDYSEFIVQDELTNGHMFAHSLNSIRVKNTKANIFSNIFLLVDCFATEKPAQNLILLHYCNFKYQVQISAFLQLQYENRLPFFHIMRYTCGPVVIQSDLDKVVCGFAFGAPFPLCICCIEAAEYLSLSIK